MTNIQIRDVPEPIVAVLKSAAKEKGLSLQAYLLEVLDASARVQRGRTMRARWPITVITGPVDYTALVNEKRDARDQSNIDRLSNASGHGVQR